MRPVFSICRSNSYISRYFQDKKGVAAIEFAFIAPILILLFIGTMEVSYAVSVDRKVSRVSSTVADLITQDSNFTADELDSLMDVSSRIMQPYEYPSDNIKISIISVSIAGGQATVDWCHNFNNGETPAVNSVYTVPDNIKIDGTRLLTTKVTLDHKPAFSFVGYQNGKLTFDASTISLSEEMFLRPRNGQRAIECPDCSC